MTTIKLLGAMMAYFVITMAVIVIIEASRLVGAIFHSIFG